MAIAALRAMSFAGYSHTGAIRAPRSSLLERALLRVPSAQSPRRGLLVYSPLYGAAGRLIARSSSSVPRSKPLWEPCRELSTFFTSHELSASLISHAAAATAGTGGTAPEAGDYDIAAGAASQGEPHALNSRNSSKAEGFSEGASLPALNTTGALVLGLMALALVLCNADRAIMSVAVLPLAQSRGWAEGTTGLVQSSFLWGYLATLFGGALADQYGGHAVLAVGLAVWSAATVLTPWAAGHSLPALLLTRAVMGAGEGVALPCMNNLVGLWVPPAGRARAVGLCMAGFHIGCLVGLLLAPPLLATSAGIHAPFVMFGAMGFAWLLLWLLLAPRTPPNTTARSPTGGDQFPKGDAPSQSGGDPLPGGEVSEERLQSSAIVGLVGGPSTDLGTGAPSSSGSTYGQLEHREQQQQQQRQQWQQQLLPGKGEGVVLRPDEPELEWGAGGGGRDEASGSERVSNDSVSMERLTATTDGVRGSAPDAEQGSSPTGHGVRLNGGGEISTAVRGSEDSHSVHRDGRPCGSDPILDSRWTVTGSTGEALSVTSRRQHEETVRPSLRYEEDAQMLGRHAGVPSSHDAEDGGNDGGNGVAPAWSEGGEMQRQGPREAAGRPLDAEARAERPLDAEARAGRPLDGEVQKHERVQLLQRAQLPPFRLLLSKGPCWAIIVAHMVNNWGYFILLSWMPLYFNQVLKTNLARGAVLNALPWAVMAVAGYGAAALADAMVAGGVATTTVRKAMQSVAFLGPALALYNLARTRSPVLGTVWLMLALGCSSFGQAGFLINYHDIAPRHKGALQGISNMAGTLAGIAGTVLTGYLVERSRSWTVAIDTVVVLFIFGTIVWNTFATAERVID